MSDLKLQVKEAKGEALAMAAQYGVTSVEFQNASQKAGELADKLKETNEAAKVFTTGSKFEAFGNSLRGVGSDLASLDFEGAGEKAKQLLAISKSMTFAEAINGIKGMGSTLASLGKALLLNPLFLLAGVIIGIVMVAKEMFDSFERGNEQLAESRKAFDDFTISALNLKAKLRDIRLQNQEDAGLISKEAADRVKVQNKLNDALIDLDKERYAREKELAEKSDMSKEQRAIARDLLNKEFLIKEKFLVKTAEEEKKNVAINAENDKNEKLAKLKEENLKKQEDLNIKKIAEEKKAEAERLKDLADYYKKEAELSIQAAELELNNFLRNNQSKLEANKFLNDELYAQEITRLESIAEAQRSFAATQFEQGKIDLIQYTEALNQITFEDQENKKALAEEKKIADNEQKAVDLANQRDIDVLNNENIFLEQEKDLERSRQIELKEAEKTGADKKLIDEKYKKFKEDLEAKQAVTTLGVAADTFGALSSLMGDNAEAAKVFAIAQATMNAFQSITAVLSAVSTIPEPAGSIAKGIQAAAIGVTAFRNVQGIANTPVPKKKAAKGGIFGGESHDNGGTKGWFSDGTQIEVEQGELFAVVNKTNTAMLSQLSALNSFGGNGVSFGSQKSYLADGGIAFTSSSTAVENQNSSVEQIVNALQSMPTPVVAVQDINEIQTQTNRIEVRAML
jgi:hypothetical protein